MKSTRLRPRSPTYRSVSGQELKRVCDNCRANEKEKNLHKAERVAPATSNPKDHRRGRPLWSMQRPRRFRNPRSQGRSGSVPPEKDKQATSTSARGSQHHREMARPRDCCGHVPVPQCGGDFSRLSIGSPSNANSSPRKTNLHPQFGHLTFPLSSRFRRIMNLSQNPRRRVLLPSSTLVLDH